MAGTSQCARSHGGVTLLALWALVACTALRAADLQVDTRDAAGQPLADMVIYAEMIGGDATLRTTSNTPVVVDQIHKEFVPRVTVIQTGTPIEFPNSDNIRHEVYSFSPAKVFTSKLYSGRQTAPVVFDKPGPVALGCNIHDHMLAWVRVVDTPYFTKSNATGSGTLVGLKPGDYQLSVWYPGADSAPQVQALHVGAAGVSMHITVQFHPPAPRLVPAAATAP